MKKRTTEDLLREVSNKFGPKIAARDRAHTFTYLGLEEASSRIAGGLMERGLASGDVVILDCPVGAELLLGLLAITRMGAVALPLHGLFRQDEITAVIELVKPAAVFGDHFHSLSSILPTYLFRDLVRAERSPVDFRPDELTPALIRTTSGTTGGPKLILVTHAQLCRRIFAPGFHYSADHVYGCPLAHTFPSYQVITALGAGGTVVFRPSVNRPQAERFIAEEDITCFWGIPALYEQIARHGSSAHPDIPQLKIAIASGALLAETTRQEVMKRWEVPVHQFYGQSELGFITETMPHTPAGSVGTATYGTELRIADDAGAPCLHGEPGHVLARTDVPFSGYVSGEPTPVDGDGWFHTGDYGHLDHEGNLFLEGRTNDFIHTGGFKVSPEEIRRIAVLCPGVTDVFVFGEDHPLRGQAPALAITGTNISISAVRKFCRDRLPAHKRPRSFYVVSEIPRNALGKADRRKLLEIIKR